MEKLSEIISFLSRHKLKGIEQIGEFGNRDSLLNKLYTGINDGNFKDEASASMDLYQTSPKNKNFKKLKYQLERRLINNIFFIDLNTPQFTDRQRARVNCYKNWAASQILLGRGARKAAIHLAEKTISITIKYGYTDLTLQIARVLSTHYSNNSNNSRKIIKYNLLIEENKELFLAEILAEKYYNDLMSVFSKKRGGFNVKAIKTAQKYSEELKEKYSNYESRDFTVFSHQVHILRFEIEMNYEQVIKACKRANQDLKRLGMESKVVFNNLKIVIALISLRKFEEAESLINELLSTINKGSYHWFIINELKVIHCFYNKNYQTILGVQIQVASEKNLKRLSPSMQYGWKLYEAYIHFFISKGLIDPTGYESKLKTFKLNKFLNDIPEGSKDKEGINIQILIIQVLFLLKDDKIDQAINRIQVLHQYAGKYLKKDSSYRSNVFIKMLIVLIRNQMHKEAVNRKAAKYLKMLKDHPIEKSKQSIGIEVVPYEDLWELIIADTKNEFRFTPAKVKKIEAAFGPRRRTPKAKK